MNGKTNSIEDRTLKFQTYSIVNTNRICGLFVSPLIGNPPGFSMAKKLVVPKSKLYSLA